MTTAAKLLFTGKTRVTSGPDGAAHANDGSLDIKLAQPHPAAENLFAAAWSACYLGALGLAAAQRKVKLPSDRSVAQELIEAAHGICPYSKAVHGNIEVTTTLV
jgi:organic hydroperoxide reductase OsmC/OhrA